MAQQNMNQKNAANEKVGSTQKPSQQQPGRDTSTQQRPDIQQDKKQGSSQSTQKPNKF